MRIAQDIINFLHLEDLNLNIIFLTLKCEDIPSIVHESEALQDVYPLLHKNEQDYNNVMDLLNQKNDLVDNYANMVNDLREEMNKGFVAISHTLRDMQTGNGNMYGL